MNQPAKIQVDMEDGERHVFKPKLGQVLRIEVDSDGRFHVSEQRNNLFSASAELVKRAYLVTPRGRFIVYKRDWR